MSQDIRTFQTEIRGITPMLQHNPYSRGEELDGLIRILGKDPNNKEAYTKEAELYTNRDESGKLCIPSRQIKRAMELSGKAFRVKGERNKSYSDYMKAFVLVNPRMIPLEPQSYELHREFVRIGTARIMRTRPMLPMGWTASFNLIVLDKSIPQDVLEDVLDYTGNFKGIGDHRGEFGRFEVTKFGALENNSSKKSKKP